MRGKNTLKRWKLARKGEKKQQGLVITPIKTVLLLLNGLWRVSQDLKRPRSEGTLRIRDRNYQRGWGMGKERWKNPKKSELLKRGGCSAPGIGRGLHKKG